ncbi:hypothetical protein [Micromonospora sp. DH14]|uniref:hypothetical protein n=1 Tax=Micromonospora sp. DH14 TaxID=3040120 RepID=UPI002441E3EA|nr:hypothetical protein [Micromonospora sp. DH14]MDG9674226.1 hypothetical protein [Micromonospora sp. DH14]
MTVVWVVAGAFVVVAGAAWVAVVRRGRVDVGDDPAAGREARGRQHRYEAERHGDQGDTWQRGREASG